MRTDVELTNFTAGELSPRLVGRSDIAKYFNGCETMLNMVAMPQGGATRRPGTIYVAANADQAAPPKLVPFAFSVNQTYVIEMGDKTARFYADDAPIVSGGSPVTLTTPYSAAQLGDLNWLQSADTLFLFHPDVPVQILTRSSASSFAIAAATLLDGPYLNQNITPTTLTPSATSGAITLTASSTAGINNGQGFLATDVGRAVRWKISAYWGWMLITGLVNAAEVTATVQNGVNLGCGGNLEGTTASTEWMLGQFSGTTGYPFVGTFWQGRMTLGGSNNQPNVINLSVTNDFLNFAPTAADGTVVAANAMSWVIEDTEVNSVNWLLPAGSAQAAQLGIGASSGEKVMQAQSTSSALSPTNVQAYPETSYGNAPSTSALRIGKAVLFVDRARRKLYEWMFTWQVNGYIGADLTVLAEHISDGLIIGQVWQSAPYGVVWAYCADGSLIGLTYMREQDVVGWHRHILGGQYYGGPPRVEGLAVIPSPNGGAYDELWLAVLRTINGVPTRSIEVMTPYFLDAPVDQAVFVDCALQTVLTKPAATATLSGLSNIAPLDQAPALSGTGVLAVSSALFSSATVGSILRMNGGAARVMAFIDAEHVSIQTLANQPFGSVAPAVSGAWSLTPLSSSVSGLGYLAGETVSALGDGMVVPPQVPGSGGVLAIEYGASFITAGLAYPSVLVPMPITPGGSSTTQGRIKRMDHLFLRFNQSCGGQFGARSIDDSSFQITDRLEPIQPRGSGDVMGEPPALFTGIRKVPALGGSDRESRVIVSQTDPLPMTVLSMGMSGYQSEVAQR